MSKHMSALTVLITGGAVGLVIGIAITFLNNKSSRQLHRARRGFQKSIQEKFPTASVRVDGGTYVHPTVWVMTSTDVERERLRQDPTLIQQFGTLLLRVGYPEPDIRLVEFVFESQETVDREFARSWSRRRYVWSRDRV